MSGGRFRYDNDTLCREMFNWSLNPEYGLGKHPDYVTSVKAARRINPMKDKVISEMLYDMFCLIHSFDWAESGDTDEEQYREDIMYFKRKWFKSKPEDFIKAQIDAEISELREELYQNLIWSQQTE